MLFDVIESMQAQLGIAETYRRVCSFMIAYLEPFQNALPTIAKEALAVARRFQHGAVSVATLEHARIQCWQYLDTGLLGTDFSQPEACAVRAVICILYVSPPDEDVAEVLDWFLVLTKKMQIGMPDAAYFAGVYFAEFDKS